MNIDLKKISFDFAKEIFSSNDKKAVAEKVANDIKNNKDLNEQDHLQIVSLINNFLNQLSGERNSYKDENGRSYRFDSNDNYIDLINYILNLLKK